MAWNKEPSRYWKDAPKPVRDYLVPAIAQYYEGKPEVQRDEAMRSCGMAAMNLMLMAKSMGYDTCPMDGFDFDKVGELLNLPKDHTPAMFVCIGKGIKEAMPRGGQLPLDQVVIHNQFK
jgi:nitroreductase